MNATGTGKGKLLYDVIHNFNLKYQIDMEMSANIKIEKMELRHYIQKRNKPNSQNFKSMTFYKFLKLS